MWVTFYGADSCPSACPFLVGCEMAACISIGGNEQAAWVVQQAQAGVLDLRAVHQAVHTGTYVSPSRDSMYTKQCNQELCQWLVACDTCAHDLFHKALASTFMQHPLTEAHMPYLQVDTT